MKNGKKFASYLLVGLGVLALPQFASAATFTVTNTSDSGVGSLRQAIINANATPASTIAFNITSTPIGNVWTIKPTTYLPNITANGTIIDGSTQTTFAGDTNPNGPEVVINGSLAPLGDAITVNASSCTLKNLVINGWGVAAININNPSSTGSPALTNNRVLGCYIGTDPSGTSAVPNFYGVLLSYANSSVIGGTTTAARNIISGNSQGGINLQYGSQNLIQGNYIGTDRTGTAQVGNNISDGIALYGCGPGNVIGGSSTAARNLISGNGASNISVSETTSVTIQNNNIGTDVTGNNNIAYLSLGPAVHGISISNYSAVPSSTDVIQIGGSSSSRNVIGFGKLTGIDIAPGSKVNIQANYIGLGRSGSTNIGNLTGITVEGNSTDVTIGGTAASVGNVITNSTRSGIDVITTTGGSGAGNPAATIRCNSIYNNGDQGIDLGGNNSVLVNDAGDGDTGANSHQNYPLISTATTSSTATTIVGTLNSNLNKTFSIDFYSIATPDATGYGEGRTYLGTASVTTNGSGNASYSFAAPVVPSGQYVTATASGLSGTSEFSAAKLTVSSPSPVKAASGSANNG